MKKVLILCATIFMLSACSGNRSKSSEGSVFSTEEVKKFIDDTSKDAAKFTSEQWVKLEKEYEDLLKKATDAGDKLSNEARETLGRLKKTFEAKKAEGQKSIKDFKDKTLDAMGDMKDDFNESINDEVDKASKSVDKQLENSKKEAAQQIEKAQKSANKKIDEVSDTLSK